MDIVSLAVDTKPKDNFGHTHTQIMPRVECQCFSGTRHVIILELWEHIRLDISMLCCFLIYSIWIYLNKFYHFLLESRFYRMEWKSPGTVKEKMINVTNSISFSCNFYHIADFSQLTDTWHHILIIYNLSICSAFFSVRPWLQLRVIFWRTGSW